MRNKKQLLIASALAGLIAGTGVAIGQGAGAGGSGGSGGGGMSAPAERTAPSNQKGGSGAMQKEERSGDRLERRGSETTGQAPSSLKPGSQEETRIDRSKGEMKGSGATDAHANGAKPAPSTTGQGAAAGAHANLTTEQRSKITTVIKRQKVEPVHLNVDVRVGTRIPQSVRYHPLPTEVVTIYPEWRGFDYILVGDTIVVIDPATREIVAVLDA